MRHALSRCVGTWGGLRRCHCAEAVCGTEALLPSPALAGALPSPETHALKNDKSKETGVSDVDANEPHGSSFADTSTNSHKLGRTSGQ